jgi:hypothetical protein
LDKLEAAVNHQEPTLSATEVGELRELIEIRKIQDVMARYVRGADRGDVDLIRSSMWEDAHDEHGVFTGSREGWIQHRLDFESTSPGVDSLYHLISPVNVLEWETDNAKVETYYHCAKTVHRDGLDLLYHLSGRYRDLFQKRNGEWRILRRKVIYDWLTVGTHSPGWEHARVPSENRGKITMQDSSYDEDW